MNPRFINDFKKDLGPLGGVFTAMKWIKDNNKDIKLFSIYKDNNGYLWLGTHENGAYKFNGTSFEKFKP